MSIVFHDVTAARKLLDELEHTNRRLETTNEELQSTVEELETAGAAVRCAMADPAFEEVLKLDAVNRRGRQAKIRVVVGALRNPNGTTQGAIQVMEPSEPHY